MKKTYIIRKFGILCFAVIFLSLGYFINGYRAVFIWKINSYLNYFRKSERNCIKEIKDIPKNSMLIIGHAYGTPIKSISRGDKGISPKLSKFFKINQTNIDEIVFSGDLLHNPSLKKWDSLFSELDKFKIYVVPGNHDVGLGKYTAKRDIFKIATQNYSINNEFPYFFEKNNSLFILDDSNLEKDNLEKIKEILSNNYEFPKIFIIRHHVLTQSMSKFSNGIPLHPLLKEKSLIEEMDEFKDKNILFIYGDGGDSRKLSLYCKEKENIKQIINGIGENKRDKILIFSENNLYFKSL
tara:strand:+ start:1299 stop:2186 length:888 start_codon:yes stop_codon:yes gene_type:complete